MQFEWFTQDIVEGRQVMAIRRLPMSTLYPVVVLSSGASKALSAELNVVAVSDPGNFAEKKQSILQRVYDAHCGAHASTAPPDR